MSRGAISATQEEKAAAFEWLRALALAGGPHARRAAIMLQEVHDLNGNKERTEEFLSETVSDAKDPSVNVEWMRCSPKLGEYVRGLELALRVPAGLVDALSVWSGAEPSQSALAVEVEAWLTAEGIAPIPATPRAAVTHGPLTKRPRLFYFEEAEDAWCPADDLRVEDIISADNLADDGDAQAIRFKRVDMTDIELATLPEL